MEIMTDNRKRRTFYMLLKPIVLDYVTHFREDFTKHDRAYFRRELAQAVVKLLQRAKPSTFGRQCDGRNHRRGVAVQRVSLGRSCLRVQTRQFTRAMVTRSRRRGRNDQR